MSWFVIASVALVALTLLAEFAFAFFRRVRPNATAAEESVHGLRKVYVVLQIFLWTGVMFLLIGDLL